jgi:hypothetical protein
MEFFNTEAQRLRGSEKKRGWKGGSVGAGFE